MAATYPLTEDEAYYWTWSLHPAFGYVDHPPAVAWLIAAGSIFGHSQLAIRFPFICCESLAAILAGYAAIALSGYELAGVVAAIALSLIPQLRWLIGEALPDGPYVLCWAAALLFAARAAKEFAWRDMVLLGVAIGGALLSRFFGLALAGGVLAFSLLPKTRVLWRRGFWLAPAVAAALYAPFVVWNAGHGWQNFKFTLQARHPIAAFSVSHLAVDSTRRYLILAALLCTFSYIFLVRMQRQPLLAWTALPFPVALAAFSFFQPVESYWLLGPFVSLCVGFGVAFKRLSFSARALASLGWSAAFASTAAIAMVGVFSPSPALGGESAVYRPLSRDLIKLAGARHGIILTDSYEISSELLYQGANALLVGNSPQTAQWSLWPQLKLPNQALLVTLEPARETGALLRRMHCAYRRLALGAMPSYRLRGTHPAYYRVWCNITAAR